MKKLSTLLFLSLLLTASCNKSDDFVVQCQAAYNMTEANVTTSAALLQWEDLNVSASFSVEYGLSGFMPGTGTTLSVTDPSVTLVGLDANTAYDYYVTSICSSSNTSLLSVVKTFSTLAEPVVPEFRPNLSELNLYSGNLSDLEPSVYTFEYQLNSALFTDYAHKQRLIALPAGTSMDYVDDGFPDFPDNTVISKTFYYNVDERDESLGKIIIETRVLIKINGEWELGNYKWNDAQTDAVLDTAGATLPVSWIDSEGITNDINYQIPSSTDCFTCHSNAGNETPIGPQLRTLNFDVNGTNQLQALKDRQMLIGLLDPSVVNTLPNWEDNSYTLEERARAYFDINCAHCHIDGGFCEFQSTLRLSYETSFVDSDILNRKNSIINRISNYNPGFSMPLIGTTIVHDDGVALILEYLDTL